MPNGQGIVGLQSMGPVMVSMVAVSRETADERSILADMGSDYMWVDVDFMKTHLCNVNVVFLCFFKQFAVLPIPSRVQELHMNIVSKISFSDNGSVIQWVVDSRTNRTKSVKFVIRELIVQSGLWMYQSVHFTSKSVFRNKLFCVVNLSFNLVRLVVCESFFHLFSNSVKFVSESVI